MGHLLSNEDFFPPFSSNKSLPSLPVHTWKSTFPYLEALMSFFDPNNNAFVAVHTHTHHNQDVTGSAEVKKDFSFWKVIALYSTVRYQERSIGQN